MVQITKEEISKGGVTVFKLGQMVWCKDKTNCNGSYTQTRYHIPCVVCDIREQKDGKITVSPFESDEYFEYCYSVDADLFEPIPRQAKVV